jgi:hypothetical protein
MLRPFFSFYGSKWGLTRSGAYPPPAHDRIVEPFCGSAGYALHWPEREVVLLDSSPVIAGIWRYLIAAPAESVAALPLDPDEALALPPGPRRDLIGFWLGRCRSTPARSASKWCRSAHWPSSFWSERIRERLALQVERIRHWRMIEADYRKAPGGPATWFVDPPYSGAAGDHYRPRQRPDFGELAAWCRSREGRVVVCEETAASWLPFRPVNGTRGTLHTARPKGRHQEAVWLSP